MYSFKKPAVFVSLIAIIQTFLVLTFPDYFTPIFIFGLISSCAVFISFYLKGEKACAILLFVLIIIVPVSSIYRYNTQEKHSQKLAEQFSMHESCKYTAKVTESTHNNNYCQLYATLLSFDGIDIKNSVKVRISLYTSDNIRPGDIITFTAKPVHVSDMAKEDSGFDTKTYLRGKSVFMDFEKAALLETKPAEDTDILIKLRENSKQILYKYLPEGSDFTSTSVCYAMFAGDMDYIPEQTADAFADSGTMHLLCVSGMHLTILSYLFSSLLSFFGINKRLRCVLIIVFCFFYTAFTGFNLSTLRAALMCAISFSALLFGRRSDALISLFVSAYIILLFSPYSIYNLSLVLSFFATLGIIVTTNSPSQDKNVFKRFLSIVRTTLLANVGAVSFTIPIIAFFFNKINIYSIVATIAVSLFCELILCGIFLLILLSFLGYFPIYENILYFFGHMIDRLSQLIIKIVEFFASLPYAVTDSGGGGLLLVTFVLWAVLLTVFTSKGFKKAAFLCTSFIVFFSMSYLITGVIFEIYDDTQYKVQYFRQNQEDRQLSIKLGIHGYLLVNADSSLCTDTGKCAFDEHGRNNYLLLIPDDIIDTDILCTKIKDFDKKYGIKKIYVPETEAGKDLGETLTKQNIECFYMPKKAMFDNIKLSFENGDDYSKLCIDDGDTKTAVIYSSSYNKDYFNEKYDICAYFTRQTKNQFDLNSDLSPQCSLFYTRLKKGEVSDSIFNTYGKKSFYIKE